MVSTRKQRDTIHLQLKSAICQQVMLLKVFTPECSESVWNFLTLPQVGIKTAYHRSNQTVAINFVRQLIS